MKLFIDCEYNDFKGALISMALVAEDGREWYEVVPCKQPSLWVEKNVIPLLNKEPIPYEDLQESLQAWLMQFDSIHIVADWPEDIRHFCDALIIGAGVRSCTPPLTMEVLRVDAGSDLPHNALYDARALRNHILMKGGR